MILSFYVFFFRFFFLLFYLLIKDVSSKGGIADTGKQMMRTKRTIVPRSSENERPSWTTV
jgi:hypothetical protein